MSAVRGHLTHTNVILSAAALVMLAGSSAGAVGIVKGRAVSLDLITWRAGV